MMETKVASTRLSFAVALFLTASIVAHAQVPTGKLETFPIQNEVLGGERNVNVYLPPNYNKALRYPVVYALNDAVYFEHLKITQWLDAAIARGMAPVVVVGVPDPPGMEGHPGEPGTPAYQQFMVKQLIPEVEKRYSVKAGRDGRLLLGFSSGSIILLDIALRNPECFGRIAMQSPGWMMWDRPTRKISSRTFVPDVLAAIKDARAPLPSVWMMWGDGSSEWESRSRENGKQVIAAFKSRGVAVIEGTMVKGEHTLHLGRESMAEAFGFLVGPQSGD